jgi:hypothetical protein
MSKLKNNPILLHLHLPKTAGGSLNRVIYSQVASPDFPTDEENSIYRGIYHYSPLQRPVTLRKPALTIHPAAINILKTRKLNAVIGHFAFGVHRYLSRRSTYVTLLRNPADRIISLYFHYIRKMGKRPEGKLTLAQFLSGFPLPGSDLQQPQLLTDNDQTRRISGLEQPGGKCTDAMLEEAKKNLASNFSVVGVTDRFDEMVVLLKREFGWLDPHKYWPAHVARARSEQTQINRETLDRIRELNQFDFALYEFANEMMDKQIENSGIDFERDISIFKSQRAQMMESAYHKHPKAAEHVETVLRRVERDSQL